MSPNKERILLLGCGGVGGVTAAGLADAGLDVTAVTANAKIAEAISTNGLVAKLPESTVHVELKAVEALNDDNAGAPFTLVLVATPPNFVKSAIEAAQPYIDDDAPFVFFQNGLAEERAATYLGEDRVVGGIVSYGASMNGPGEVEQTSAGGYVIGRLNGTIDKSIERVVAVLAHAGEVETTQNLRGARWSKLAINCAVSSLGTVGGDRLGALMRHRFVRRLCLEVMTEVTQVAVASGVDLEKVSGTLDLEWLALDRDERLAAGSPSLFAKHTVLLAVGAKYRRLRSSMLAAIERGREPSVDFLNGEVVERGAKLSIETPINAALMEAVHAISRGDRQSSLETLRGVFDETRSTLRELKLAA